MTGQLRAVKIDKETPSGAYRESDLVTWYVVKARDSLKAKHRRSEQ